MKAGVSKICITPPVGIDLCGFVDRVQPSIGLHDDLYVRGLYIEDQQNRLLWLNCDLISIAEEQVKRVREYCRGELGIHPHQVIVSATHTHSGPAAIQLRGCGEIDENYIEFLDRSLIEAAKESATNLEPVNVYFSEGESDLAVDRRWTGSSRHVDHRLPVVSFKRMDGTFKGLLSNYAMHSVALTSENRLISGDVLGVAAESAGKLLPGDPVVLLTSGGCANTIPSQRSRDPEKMVGLADQLSREIVETAEVATFYPDHHLATHSEFFELSLSLQTREGVQAEYQREERRFDKDSPWLAAIKEWRDETLAQLEAGPVESVRTELQVIRIGKIGFTAISAEVFTYFAEELRAAAGQWNYVVGNANGNVGYIPYWEIYREGGYEVETAYKFYGNFVVAPGNYVRLRDRTIEILNSMGLKNDG